MSERVALVSGAARGIGFEVVRELASDGLFVFLGARDVAAGEEARSSLGALAERVEVVALDIADQASVDACADVVRTRFGRLDVLVNNSGIILDRGVSPLDVDFEVVRQTVEVNLFGAWRLTIAVVDLLRAAAPSRVVNVSSGMAQLSEMLSISPGYRISKVGMNAMTRMLHAELGSEGISVNSMCPGWVQTPMGGEGAYLSVAEGADTILWLLRLPDDEMPAGGFYKRRELIAW
ncbi:MAG: SDR family NAD(P)-dependent oxidoreductase [Solirubrobacteraceae bacterium]|nr:SDR family NAD(P)-dependent oxidoreductase [Solirubrobacteraceae bacterium]